MEGRGGGGGGDGDVPKPLLRRTPCQKEWANRWAERRERAPKLTLHGTPATSTPHPRPGDWGGGGVKASKVLIPTHQNRGMEGDGGRTPNGTTPTRFGGGGAEGEG